MTWEEWVATQAELALTSSMANLNHTVWKLRETFVLNPKNEKKRRREYLYTMLLWAALALWCGVVVSFPNSKFPAFLGFSLPFLFFSSFSAHFFQMEKNCVCETRLGHEFPIRRVINITSRATGLTWDLEGEF